jgi:amino acid transporter
MQFQIYLTAIFLFIVLCVVVVGFSKSEFKNLQPYFLNSSGGGILAGIIGVFATVPFWLVGFDTIPQGAEEASEKVSPRMIGLLILISLSAAVIFYVLLILSTAMIGNWQALLGSDLLTAKAFELAFGSDILVKIILIAIIIGLLTSWNGFFLAGSRVLFAMGRGKIISAQFGETHQKFGTPYKAVLFSGVITLAAAFLGRGALIAFVDVGSFCIAAAFLGVSFSYLKLKRAFPDLKRPYVAPGGKIMGYLSIIGSTLVLLAITLPGSPAALKWPLEWAILITLSVLGLIIWIISKKSRSTTSKEERDYLILERFK